MFDLLVTAVYVLAFMIAVGVTGIAAVGLLVFLASAAVWCILYPWLWFSDFNAERGLHNRPSDGNQERTCKGKHKTKHFK